MEIPIQQMWCDFADLTLVRVILLHPDTTDQAQFFHESLDSFMIEGQAAIVHLRRDTAITVPPSVFMVDRGELFFGRFVFICALHPFHMIVESCAGQLSD